jgi:hypothetical protein
MVIAELGRLDGFRVGAVGPLLITVFHQTATLERLSLLEEVQTRFITTHPKMYALNVVVGDSVKQPTVEVRERAAAMQKRFDGSTATAVTVLAVKGLAAAIARGFMAALALVSSGSKTTEVFKTATEALAWLQTLPAIPPELRKLDAPAIEAFVAGAL